MILGVGTDLIEIKRMEKACRRPHFVARTFTETESRQAKGSASKLAGSFAVKEAVAKMFGTGFRGFMPGDIEVLRDELGKPYVNLYGGAKKRNGADTDPCVYLQYRGFCHGICSGRKGNVRREENMI